MGAKRHAVSSPRTYWVLCVDDHAPGLTIRRIFLESFGYAVQTAGSGEAALELAQKHRFDAVVMDYRMPGMNGLELARTFHTRFPDLPLIVLSGFSSELPSELHELARAFVAKGAHPEVLLEKLRGVLGQQARPKRPRADAAELMARTQEQLEESKRQVQRASQAAAQARRGGKGRRSA